MQKRTSKIVFKNVGMLVGLCTHLNLNPFLTACVSEKIHPLPFASVIGRLKYKFNCKVKLLDVRTKKAKSIAICTNEKILVGVWPVADL